MTTITGAGTSYVRPTDNRGLEIYTKEEKAARYAQAKEARRAREAERAANPEKFENLTPEQKAMREAMPARLAEARADMIKHGIPLPEEGSGKTPTVPSQMAGELTEIRAAFLSFLNEGGLADTVRREAGDEAADDYVASVQSAIHDFDRKLGRTLTSFASSGREQASTQGRVDFSV